MIKEIIQLTRNRIKKNLMMVCLAGIFSVLIGCTKNFDEINTRTDVVDANNISLSMLGQAFAQGQYYGCFASITSFQVLHNLYTDQWVQYYTTTHPNFFSDQFQENGVWTGQYGWDQIYSIPGPQIKYVIDFTQENNMPVENAIAKVWRTYFFSILTDRWGPIIYSNYGTPEVSVDYDSQEDVYHDFFRTLDEVVPVLKANMGKTSSFGINDQIFSGDVSKWLTFANSLRLRLAMRLSYIEPDLARSQAELAIQDEVMTDNSQNALLVTVPDPRTATNFYAQITYISEFRTSATILSVMKGFNDPRMEIYFAPAVGRGGYHGIRNGLSTATKGLMRNNLQDNSAWVAHKWMPSNMGGSSPKWEIFNAAEAYFLRAEGALRNWNMGGTAEELYNQGIRASLIEWTDLSNSEMNAFINSSNTPGAMDDQLDNAWNAPKMSDITIKYMASADFEKQLEQIITQKWLAIFPNSEEAWAERRRTGYPVGYKIVESINTDVPRDAIMRRLTFATREFTTNADAVAKAIGMLGPGGDKNSTRLWWDAKPLNLFPEPVE